jgi:hypothetical protein
MLGDVTKGFELGFLHELSNGKGNWKLTSLFNVDPLKSVARS